MRAAIGLGLLAALAACDENTGWNPNYVVADRPYGAAFDATTPYARYKYDRERALMGRAAAADTIPRARPFDAPKPAAIYGPNAWQILRREAMAVTAEAESRKPPVVRSVVVAEPALPEAWRPGARAAGGRGAVVLAAPSPSTPTTAGPGLARPLPVTTSGPYPGSTPVLVRYALTATHAAGTAVWARPGADADAATRACRSYADADAAQIAFIAAGGPEADPRRMDPDGDGFVCGWDPAPWRRGAGL